MHAVCLPSIRTKVESRWGSEVGYAAPDHESTDIPNHLVVLQKFCKYAHQLCEQNFARPQEWVLC